MARYDLGKVNPESSVDALLPVWPAYDQSPGEAVTRLIGELLLTLYTKGQNKLIDRCLDSFLNDQNPFSLRPVHVVSAYPLRPAEAPRDMREIKPWLRHRSNN